MGGQTDGWVLWGHYWCWRQAVTDNASESEPFIPACQQNWFLLTGHPCCGGYMAKCDHHSMAHYNTYTQFLNHKTSPRNWQCVFPIVHIKTQTWSQWEQPCIWSVSSVCHASSSCLWLVLVSRAWVWTSWDRLIKQRSRETENVSESGPGLRGYSVTLASVWWNAGTK